MCLRGSLQSVEEDSKFNECINGHLSWAQHHIRCCRICHPCGNGGNDIAPWLAVDHFPVFIVEAPMHVHGFAVKQVPGVVNRY